MRVLQLVLVLFIWSGGLQAAVQDTPGELSDRARKAMESGNYAEAIPLYRQLIKSYPDVPGLRLNLGMAYYFAGDYRKAVPELEAALKGDKKLEQARMLLGSAYVLTGQNRRAVAPLQEYLRGKPEDPRAHEALGEALLALGEHAKAEVEFRKVSELEPSNPKAWQGRGKAFEALAASAFARLESQAPDSEYCLALIADSRVVRQQYRSAFYLYRKALEKNSRLRGIHVALSRIYSATGHSDWAAEEEQKEVALGLPDCQSEKIVCAFLDGRLEEVVSMASASGSLEALYWLSQAYNQLALDAFSRLGKLPPSFELHQLRAEVFEDQGDYIQAAKEWEKALELAPGNPAAQRGLALSLFLSRSYDRAKPLLDRLLQADPSSAELNYLAGEILLNQEKAGEAVKFLEKAVAADKAFVPAHKSLGRAFLALQQPARAIPHLELALGADEDGSIHYQLAQALRSSGELERARVALEKYQQFRAKDQAEKARLEEEAQITPP